MTKNRMKKSVLLILSAILCGVPSWGAPAPLSGDKAPVISNGQVPESDKAADFNEGIKAWNSGDYEVAYCIFQLNAEKGLSQAMTALGCMYASGSGVAADLATAMRWYRMAAAGGEPYAMYALYELTYAHPERESHPGEAREMLKAAVEKNTPIACEEYYHLLLQKGKNEEALKYVKKCAEDEQFWAMTAYGVILSERETPSEADAGLELLKKSADKGDVTACYVAADLEKKRGHMDEAKKLHALAAKADYAPSMYELGLFALDEGKGDEACELLLKAGENGVQGAYLLLGHMSEQGKAVKKDLSAAAHYYKTAADAGEPAGYNELGRLTEKGIGSDQSYEDAYRLYALGAEGGNSEALYNLGRMEIYGLGIEKNEASGLAKLEKAAAMGQSEAMTALAAFYMEGKIVAADRGKALSFYREAADLGNPRAQFLMGEQLKSDTDREKMDQALKYYEKSAESGYADAQFALAQYYSDDRQRTPDPVRAVKWYQAAAGQGHPAAMYALGVLRLNEAKKDSEINAAVSMIDRAAEAGCVPADYTLGLLYGQGRLVERNIYSAVVHYRRAAERGDINAQLRLAGIMKRGDSGYPVNLQESFRWYAAAAEGGNMQAQYNLGFMRLRGIGTWKDADEALKWLEKSAQSGYVPAQNLLGTLYSEGVEVKRSFDLAQHWLRAAAGSGSAAAQFNLGLLYSYSPEAGPSDAISWFEQAANQGHALATWYLGSAYEEGRGVEADLVKARQYYQLARDAGNERAVDSLQRLAQKEKNDDTLSQTSMQP